MRAPQTYVEQALAIIEPPAEQREAVRSELMRYLETLPRIAAKVRHPAVMAAERGATKRQRCYLKHLRATRDACPDLPDWPPASTRFVQELDAEIDRVQQELRSRHGHKPRDGIASMVVLHAAEYLPAKRRTLTNGGPWHLLSMLLYEVATGQPNRDHLLNYMRRMKRIARCLPLVD
jgi:hypothetical protein